MRQASGCNTFKLDLPVMLQVHPAFNVLLLHQCMGDIMLPITLVVDEKMKYIIDKIVWYRGRPRHYKYLVSCARYDKSKDMWLLEANLSNLPNVQNEYKLVYGL